MFHDICHGWEMLHNVTELTKIVLNFHKSKIFFFPKNLLLTKIMPRVDIFFASGCSAVWERTWMGFKGSKVQILSSRPENRNPKGSTGTWVPFLFLAPEEPGLGAGPFPSFRCSCLPAMSRGRIIRDQTSRWSLDYGKSFGVKTIWYLHNHFVCAKL